MPSAKPSTREHLAALLMADALRELTAGTAPLVDDHPRRIRSSLHAEPPRRAAWLMDANAGRQRRPGM